MHFKSMTVLYNKELIILGLCVTFSALNTGKLVSLEIFTMVNYLLYIGWKIAPRKYMVSFSSFSS